MELWAHRTIDNHAASPMGLHIIEGIYAPALNSSRTWVSSYKPAAGGERTIAGNHLDFSRQMT
jgi:hypothetical protein